MKQPTPNSNLLPIDHLPPTAQEFITTVVTLLSDRPEPKGVGKILQAVADKTMSIEEANKKIQPYWEKRMKRLYREYLKSIKANASTVEVQS
jgi:hypothetical protein